MNEPKVGDVWERYGKRFHVTKVDQIFSTFVEEGVTDRHERWMNRFVFEKARLIERDGKAVQS